MSKKNAHALALAGRAISATNAAFKNQQTRLSVSFNQLGKTNELLLRCHSAVTLFDQVRPTVLNFARVGAH